MSAVSVGLHIFVLRAQIGESGVLAVGNCQPSVGQLDVYELFQGTALYHQKSFAQLTERVQLLCSEILS